MNTNGAMDLRAGAAAGKGGGGRPFVGFVIALLLAAASAAAAYAFRGDTPLWMVALAALGSFMGLLFLVGVAAGFVHIGSLPRQRAFYDGLFEALGDALVVTDARGRAIYANAAYRALLAQASLPRQVGVENLYSGYPKSPSAFTGSRRPRARGGRRVRMCGWRQVPLRQVQGPTGPCG